MREESGLRCVARSLCVCMTITGVMVAFFTLARRTRRLALAWINQTVEPKRFDRLYKHNEYVGYFISGPKGFGRTIFSR